MENTEIQVYNEMYAARYGTSVVVRHHFHFQKLFFFYTKRKKDTILYIHFSKIVLYSSVPLLSSSV